jgi:dUTP pyrophosphatase
MKIKLDEGARVSRAHGEETVRVKRTTETAIIPERKSIGAAGFDLCIDSDTPIVVPPHSTVMVQSGIAFEIPQGYFGAVYARSGISTRESIRPATCVSVIDSDYRGSVGLPLHNDTDTERIIEPYSRVAQIVFQKALIVDLEFVDELGESERGENGFGSTGR